MRRRSFESQCPSSTESFCEQPHNGALKPTLPGGETREWGRVDYPHLWRYKTPGQVVMMLAVESLVLVTCRRAMRSLWHQTIQRCSLPTGESFSFMTDLQRYPEIFCLCWDGIHLSLQHCSMASVGALLMFLPVAWTCSPQKAGKHHHSVPKTLVALQIPHYRSIQGVICSVHWEFDNKSVWSEDLNSFLKFVSDWMSLQTMLWCHVSPTLSLPTSQSVLTAGRSTSCLWVESVTLGFTARASTASSSQT